MITEYQHFCKKVKMIKCKGVEPVNENLIKFYDIETSKYYSLNFQSFGSLTTYEAFQYNLDSYYKMHDYGFVSKDLLRIVPLYPGEKRIKIKTISSCYSKEMEFHIEFALNFQGFYYDETRHNILQLKIKLYGN